MDLSFGYCHKINDVFLDSCLSYPITTVPLDINNLLMILFFLCSISENGDLVILVILRSCGDGDFPTF